MQVLEDQDPEFALVVGAARSGTTLQRLLLDAHPDVGCPAEAGIPALMAHMAQVWGTINAEALEYSPSIDPGQPMPDKPVDGDAAGTGGGTPDTAPLPTLSPLARDWISTSALAAMRSYCDSEHKRLYVDKSLDSVYHLELVRQVFPRARYVLAVRHVMDTIASGIEASPWGFSAYGYAPYVQRFPGNAVAALGSYWVDHVSSALAWEKRHPELCFRVRYEDLVTGPEETVTAIQRFLGVEESLSVLTAAFRVDHARGPADYKIEHTASVHAKSIGHGKRVPVSMLPPPLLTAINEQLEALGYPPLDRSWNAAEREFDALSPTIWSKQLEDVMREAQLAPDCPNLGVFAVVAEDHHALRWIIDTEDRSIVPGDGDVDAVLTGTTEDLLLMISEEENLGVLLRSGRIRHLVSDEQRISPQDTYEHAIAIVAALRACVGTNLEVA
jgi:hypothetical protein